MSSTLELLIDRLNNVEQPSLALPKPFQRLTDLVKPTRHLATEEIEVTLRN